MGTFAAPEGARPALGRPGGQPACASGFNHWLSGTPVGWIQPSCQATMMPMKRTTETAMRKASARIMWPPLELPLPPPRSM